MRATISFVNHPKTPDGKYGNLKTNDNQRIMVPVQNLGQYERGRTYDIPTSTKTWTPGEPPVIVAVGDPLPVGFIQQPQTRQAPSPAPTNYAQPYEAARGALMDPPDDFPPSDTVGRSGLPQAPAPSPAPFRGNPEARGIFLTGVVGRAMGSGKFSASEIEVLLVAAMDAYDRRMG
jgi:hypothetical protein